jgi:membrane dipeptidase
MSGLSREAAEVHAAALLVDLHCDLLLTSYFLGWDWRKAHAPNPLPGAPLMGHCDLPRLVAGNWGCLALGVVTNPLRGESGPAAISSDLDRMEAEIARAPEALVRVHTAAEVRAARKAGKIAVFAGLEGAHGLNGSLDPLPGFAERGLGYVGLVHFSKNAACRPMVGWGQSETEGLTNFGRDLVDACRAHRVMVDVAHVNKPGVLETCKRAQAPVICSHTAMSAVHPSPRNIDDAQLRAIADTGGVVGVIFVAPFLGRGGVDAVVAHLDHIKKTVGVAHAAIGTDWEGFATYPADLNSADKMPILTEALLKKGWTADEIFACYGENALRVMEAVRG